MTRLLGRAGTIVAVTLVAAGAALLWFPAGAVDGDFVQGSGQAGASVLRLGPSTGRLSLAPQVGIALADYTGTVGRGESRLFDFAALDDSVPPELKTQFPPARATSTEDGAAKGEERVVAGGGSGSISGGGSVQRASATKEPIGRSSYSLGALSIPGVVEVAGARATASAGVVAANVTREARGTTVIDQVSVGGGRVVLRGLRWEATQRTGEGAAVESAFTVGGAEVAGQTLPLPAGSLEPAIGPINAALAPSGLAIDLPRATVDNGVARVSPLAVRIVDSALGRQLLAPVLAGAQPARDPVAELIFTHMSEASGLVLVGDVGIGVASGAGRLDLELGGTSAFTEGEFFESPFDFDFGGAGGGTTFDVGSAGDSDFRSLARSDTDGPAGSVPDGPVGAQAAPGTPQTAQASRTTTSGGARGGAAAIVGAVGLLTALGVALADYRAMRDARRIVPIR